MCHHRNDLFKQMMTNRLWQRKGNKYQAVINISVSDNIDERPSQNSNQPQDKEEEEMPLLQKELQIKIQICKDAKKCVKLKKQRTLCYIK